MVNGITNKIGNKYEVEYTRDETYTISSISQPIYSGAYRIGGETGVSISFSLSDKPSWINRQFCKWCLGWEWIENN